MMESRSVSAVCRSGSNAGEHASRIWDSDYDVHTIHGLRVGGSALNVLTSWVEGSVEGPGNGLPELAASTDSLTLIVGRDCETWER